MTGDIVKILIKLYTILPRVHSMFPWPLEKCNERTSETHPTSVDEILIIFTFIRYICIIYCISILSIRTYVVTECNL